MVRKCLSRPILAGGEAAQERGSSTVSKHRYVRIMVEQERFEGRLEQLEGQHRRLWGALGVMGVLLILLGGAQVRDVLGSLLPESRSYMAQAFFVAEEAGRRTQIDREELKASLGVFDGDVRVQLRGGEDVQALLNVSSREALWTLQQEGGTVSLGGDAHGHQALVFENEAYESRLALGIHPDGTPYLTVERAGQVVYELPLADRPARRWSE